MLDRDNSFRSNKRSSSEKTQLINPNAARGVKRVGRTVGSVFGAIGRVITIGILTVLLTTVLLVLFGAIYIANYLDVDTGIDLNQFDLALTSTILVESPVGSGNWEVLETLSGRENRIWLEFDDIPQHLIDAAVAIEDRRFWEHNGVDWRRTIAAFTQLFQPGGGSFGGSTITQQLIKNLTQDNEATVSRKLQEIFRALAFERNHPGVEGKELILEYYLNTVYFGGGRYGILTAAEHYFGKTVEELTVAESASLIGITNNPSLFNPFTNPRNNKRRQEVILREMYAQGMLSRHQFNLAKYQPLNFTRREIGSYDNRNVRCWFASQLIRDLTVDLMERNNWTRELARQYIFSGGIEIYATLDLEVQAALDMVWEDDDRWPDSPDAEPAESAMVIIEQETGVIRAMIGGREKLGDDVFDFSTMARRSPGSAIKPLTAFAPAFDKGLLNHYSPVDDVPFRNVNGRPWPRNSPQGFSGRMSALQAIAVSKNTVPVHIVDMLGPEEAFDFARERFGLNLIEGRTIGDRFFSDVDLAPLALGQLTDGLTVRELTEAYAAIANHGIRNPSRLYTHFVDPSGNVFENTPEPIVAIRAEAAYSLEVSLIAAVTSGTGGRARLARTDIPVAGKTGTTSANHDRWFAGFTPHYTAVTWFGYPIGRDMGGYFAVGNPAIHMWRQVMDIIHEDLEGASFAPPIGMENFNFCADTGLLPGNHCSLDPRGSRVRAGRLAREDIPTQTCDVHVPVRQCTASGHLATSHCAPETSRTIALLDYDRWVPIAGFSVPDAQYFLRRGGSAAGGDGMYRPAGSGPLNTPCPLCGPGGVPPDDGDDGDYDAPDTDGYDDVPPVDDTPPPSDVDATPPDASPPPEELALEPPAEGSTG